MVKQVRVVLNFQNGLAQRFRRIDEQLEVLKVAWVRQELHIHTHKTQFVALRRLVEVKHHVDQRQTAGVTLDRELFQQRAIAHLLMLSAIEHHRLSGFDQLAKSHAVENVQAQRQHVDAVANQVLFARSRLPRNRRADDKVLLPCQTMQHGGKTRQHGHKIRSTEFRTRLFELVRQFFRKRKVDASGGIGLECRPSAICGQIQLGQARTRKLVQPITLRLGVTLA